MCCVSVGRGQSTQGSASGKDFDKQPVTTLVTNLLGVRPTPGRLSKFFCEVRRDVLENGN